MQHLSSTLLALALAVLPASASAIGGTHRSAGTGSHASRNYSGGSSRGRSQHHSSGSSHAPRPPRSRSYTPPSGRSRSYTPKANGSHSYSSRKQGSSPTARRDSHGRIKRNEEAKDQFERQTGFPHGRPGYVVDHIRPLACGGADSPSNMQWQTIQAAKAKDKTERKGC